MIESNLVVNVVYDVTVIISGRAKSIVEVYGMRWVEWKMNNIIRLCQTSIHIDWLYQLQEKSIFCVGNKCYWKWRRLSHSDIWGKFRSGIKSSGPNKCDVNILANPKNNTYCIEVNVLMWHILLWWRKKTFPWHFRVKPNFFLHSMNFSQVFQQSIGFTSSAVNGTKINKSGWINAIPD